MSSIENKKITPTLKSMDIGDVEEFQKKQLTSISSTITRLHYSTDLRFETTRNDACISVKRVS